MNIDFEGETLDTSNEVSSMMNYVSPVFKRVGNLLAVGYLTDDQDCSNPLEDWDGNGKIFFAHRHASRESHQKMQEALGLNADWRPAVDSVEDKISTLLYCEPKRGKSLLSVFARLWVEAAAVSVDFQKWCLESGQNNRLLARELLFHSTNGIKIAKSSNAMYYQRRARKMFLAWVETGFDRRHRVMDPTDFDCYSDVQKKMWEKLVDDGALGNPDVVVLDCYEHGGQHWSLSGNGMQCRWDTSRGAGVWVPDSCALDEINRRMKVYAYGSVECNGSWTKRSGKLRFFASVDATKERSPDFMEWHDAFKWLESKKQKVADLPLGRKRADRELAQQSLDVYNEWLSGNCYGVVADLFSCTSEGEWEFVTSDACYGYVGSEYAEEELPGVVESILIQAHQEAA